jgi:protein subunit release factor A
MSIPKKDLKIEYTRGKGPGGQHKNKTNSKVKITHIPTGVVVEEDGRDQHHNKKIALRKLEERIKAEKRKVLADKKKAKRDKAIHETPIIRTYNYKRSTVKDHRSGKTASLKKVMNGNLDLLR